jgi:hypothetical protein
VKNKGASERPIAGVLDTSHFDKGHFNANNVRSLAKRLSIRDVELWIPQQVIDEWAVHAEAVLQQLHQAHKRAHKAGLVNSEAQPERQAADIAASFHHLCSQIPNVVILEMGGDAAIAGIRDQILGTGPGTVENGVRTGASDSSWVRDALGRAKSPTRIVFVTRNCKDVLATAKAMGYDDMLIRMWNGDQKRFDELFPPKGPRAAVDDATAMDVIAGTLLRDYREAAVADDRSGPPPAWIEVVDVSINSDPASDTPLEAEDWLETYAVMEPYSRLIDVRDVTIEADGEHFRVYYTVRLLADVRVEGLVFDNDGNALTDSTIQRDRVLAVPYTAVLREGALHDVEQIDIAGNWPAAHRFDDCYDAFHWIFHDEIAEWPYITVTAVSEEGSGAPERGFELRGPQCTEERATVVGYPDDWQLSFEQTSVVISATYDPDSRVWLGRQDSFNMYRPVGLHTELQGAPRLFAEPYTGLAEVWAYLVGGGSSRDTATTPSS